MHDHIGIQDTSLISDTVIHQEQLLLLFVILSDFVNNSPF